MKDSRELLRAAKVLPSARSLSCRCLLPRGEGLSHDDSRSEGESVLGDAMLRIFIKPHNIPSPHSHTIISDMWYNTPSLHQDPLLKVYLSVCMCVRVRVCVCVLYLYKRNHMPRKANNITSPNWKETR